MGDCHDDDGDFNEDFERCEAHNEFFKGRPDRVCRYCGLTGLHWEQFKGAWRLFDSNKVLHACAQRTQAATVHPCAHPTTPAPCNRTQPQRPRVAPPGASLGGASVAVPGNWFDQYDIEHCGTCELECKDCICESE